MEDTFKFEMNIKQGIYKHYKGDIYRVIGIGLHSETQEALVIYHQMDNHNLVWLRPLTNFFENIETEEYSGQRFEYIGDGSN